jgi:hypothetical protein
LGVIAFIGLPCPKNTTGMRGEEVDIAVVPFVRWAVVAPVYSMAARRSSDGLLPLRPVVSRAAGPD